MGLLSRYDTASATRAEADERARGAISRADTETARAERAEAELLRIREQAQQARTDRDGLWDQISALRQASSLFTTGEQVIGCPIASYSLDQAASLL